MARRSAGPASTSLPRCAARQTVAFDVARGYFELLFAQAFVHVHEQAVKQAESVLNDTKVRLKNGTADREAVLRAEVEVTQAQEQLVAARQRVFDGMAALNLALGRPTALPIRVHDVRKHPRFELPLEACLEQAVSSRPEVSAAREAVAEATYGVEAARGGVLPKIYVRGTVVRVDSAQELRGWVTGAGLHLDQPLYAGGKHLADMRRSRALTAAATAGLQSLLDRVAYQVNVAYQAIATGQERIALGETGVTQARENLRLTLVKFNNGNASPTDVVDAQTAQVRAEARYYTARVRIPRGARPAGVQPGRRSIAPGRRVEGSGGTVKVRNAPRSRLRLRARVTPREQDARGDSLRFRLRGSH